MYDPFLPLFPVQESETIWDLDEFFGCKESDGPAELFIRWWQGSLTDQQSFVMKVIAWGIVLVIMALWIPRQGKK